MITRSPCTIHTLEYRITLINFLLMIVPRETCENITHDPFRTDDIFSGA